MKKTLAGAGFEHDFAFADKTPAATIHCLWICQPAVNILWQSAYAVLAVTQRCNSIASMTWLLLIKACMRPITLAPDADWVFAGLL